VHNSSNDGPSNNREVLLLFSSLILKPLKNYSCVHCGLYSYHALAQWQLHFFLNRELKALSTQAVPVLLYILIIPNHEKNEILLTHIQLFREEHCTILIQGTNKKQKY